MGKKRKNYYVDKSSFKKGKYTSSEKLASGACGFLITHDRQKEKLCMQNAFQLLNHYADQWYGEFKKSISGKDVEDEASKTDDNKQSNDDGDENEFDDIELTLAKEVETLQNSIKSKDSFRFHSLKSGCNNLIFIKSNDVKPSSFLHRLVKDLSLCGKDNFATPFVLRMHPVDVSCKAHLADIKTLAEVYISSALNELWDTVKNEDDLKKEFDIIFRHRNNNDMNRTDVYDAITSALQDTSCEWKYNCRTTKFVLIVEVLKNICCMGVASDYARYKKFNIKELQLSVSLSDKLEKNKHMAKSNKPVLTDAKNTEDISSDSDAIKVAVVEAPSKSD